MGRWKDPAPPCRHLPCTAVGSSAQSPRIPSILQWEVGSMSQHSCPWPELPSDAGTVGLLILQSPTPPPPSSQSLWGRRLLRGRGWVWGEAGREREQQRTNLTSSSLQPPPLSSVKWEEGALVVPLRTQQCLISNLCPLLTLGQNAGSCQPFPGWKPKRGQVLRPIQLCPRAFLALIFRAQICSSLGTKRLHSLY